ncbi:hypothetical protein UL82_00085 [Corynebacterium kutscheri]|uniref:Uncharacterized protein n=1 Tax=Corynebacterium kutscheri TaxID=35755 RepID=A0A0F6TCQ1_9CORY|nr:hypothetical protein [Corynebacterium kutscheri]AKE40261.1 hypothetical protein UL82_00085 [Corynebacterium kutscheri]VEH10653.1 putative secreted protein [Corynebacterium kutscheri]
MTKRFYWLILSTVLISTLIVIASIIFVFAKDSDLETTHYEGPPQSLSFSNGTNEGKYRLYTAGIDLNKPYGVLIRLHGDGGDTEANLNALAAVARKHNMVLLTPFTPDRETLTWWKQLPTNRLWLQNLLEQRIYTLPHVDTSNMWWSGYSGGAEMLSYSILPNSPELVTGGAVLLGGGGAPGEVNKQVSQHTKETLPLWWVTGKLNNGAVPASGNPQESFDALSAAHNGSNFYRNQGFRNITTEFPDGIDHYSLNQAEIVNRAITQAKAQKNNK